MMREMVYPGRQITLTKFFKERYLPQLASEADFEILDTASYVKEHYVVLREKASGRKVARIIFLKRDGDNILVTEIDEDESILFRPPFGYCCPEKLLDILSDTNTKNALLWRKKCRKMCRLKGLGPGAVIHFSREIRFTNGANGKLFEIESVKPYTFKALDGALKGMSVKIENWLSRNPKIVKEIMKLDVKRRKSAN